MFDMENVIDDLLSNFKNGQSIWLFIVQRRSELLKIFINGSLTDETKYKCSACLTIFIYYPCSKNLGDLLDAMSFFREELAQNGLSQYTLINEVYNEIKESGLFSY